MSGQTTSCLLLERLPIAKRQSRSIASRVELKDATEPRGRLAGDAESKPTSLSMTPLQA